MKRPYCYRHTPPTPCKHVLPMTVVVMSQYYEGIPNIPKIRPRLCFANTIVTIDHQALFLKTLLPWAGASAFAFSTFALAAAGAAFFCTAVFAAVVVFAAPLFPAVLANALPTFFTIIVPVEVPEALLLSLAVLFSLPDAAAPVAAIAPRVERVTTGLGPVVALAVLRVVVATVAAVDVFVVVALAPDFVRLPLTIFARLAVAAAAAALIGDVCFKGDCGRKIAWALLGEPRGGGRTGDCGSVRELEDLGERMAPRAVVPSLTRFLGMGTAMDGSGVFSLSALSMSWLCGSQPIIAYQESARLQVPVPFYASWFPSSRCCDLSLRFWLIFSDHCLL